MVVALLFDLRTCSTLTDDGLNRARVKNHSECKECQNSGFEDFTFGCRPFVVDFHCFFVLFWRLAMTMLPFVSGGLMLFCFV